jgi:hypothetical protein
MTNLNQIKEEIKRIFRRTLENEIRNNFSNYVLINLELGREKENKPFWNLLLKEHNLHFRIRTTLPFSDSDPYSDLAIKFIIGNLYQQWMDWEKNKS